MPIGRSLHIGLDAVDPEHYAGWTGLLHACVYDALDMRDLARERGFETTTLLDGQATRDACVAGIRSMLDASSSGDIVLLTYSGHGSSLADANGDETGDRRDETWCLHDGQLLDDELWRLWVTAPAGLRIVVLSDSCHSGTILKAADAASVPVPDRRHRRLDRTVAGRVYRRNRAMYDAIATEPRAELHTLAASVLLLSGCQDDEYSYEGDGNGEFTSAVLSEWGHGRFSGTYRSFHRALQRRLADVPQHPNLMLLGDRTGRLISETPFTI